MPHNISPQGTIEKNKIASAGAWLLLFEFIYKNEEPIRVCLNNEEIMWNGEKWYPAIFSVSAITETKESEVNSIPFSIVDINRRLTPIIDKYNGAMGAVVYMRTVHSNHLNLTEPEREDRFEVVKANIDHGNKITFTLGQENLINRRCPTHRYFKNYCRFKFKSDLCGYSGPETECSLTFARCRVLGNQRRFGGFPGVGREGFFIL